MSVQKMKFGGWEVNISDDPVKLNPDQIKEVSDFLTNRYLPVAMRLYRADYRTHTFGMTKIGVPSPVVRLDMPPMNGHWKGIFEVEANPAGWGIAESISLGMTEKVAEAFHSLRITKITFAVAPSREAQREDLEVFAAALSKHGIETSILPFEEVGKNNDPLWLRAGQEDLEQLEPLLPRCLLLHYHGGGHKRYLYEVDDARPLASFADPLKGPFETYPNGFAVKPDGGWGTMILHTWCPEKPWKEKGLTASRMKRELHEIVEAGKADEFVVQKFGHPEHRDGNYRIWRLFALWDGESYRPIGGFWAERRSLMVHGANDCVMGPLTV